MNLDALFEHVEEDTIVIGISNKADDSVRGTCLDGS